MLIKAIIEKKGALEVYEERSVADDYCELVFYAKDADGWNAVLSEVMGPPVKPAGENPSREDQRITKKHQGIFKNQTLYRKDADGTTTIAMLWPWQDGQLITLKVAVL